MSNPHILIVIGTPLPDSFNHSLAAAYTAAATAEGAEVRVIDLAAGNIPAHPSQRAELRVPRDVQDIPLDERAQFALDSLEWADHIALFYPQWWGTYPAALKAWIDRVFISGATFRYAKSGKGWHKLARGRTARIVTTMDSPSWWSRFVYKDAGVRALKSATLGYCGIKTIGVTRIPQVRHTERTRLVAWVETTGSFGSKDARRSINPRKAPFPKYQRVAVEV